MRVFWWLLPGFKFWKGDWALCYISNQIWDFLIFPYFLKDPKSLVVQQFMRKPIYQAGCSRYHVSFYLWIIQSGLKHTKVPKYYGQDCLKIFFSHSTLGMMIQISTKNAHWFKKVSSVKKLLLNFSSLHFQWWFTFLEKTLIWFEKVSSVNKLLSNGESFLEWIFDLN